MSKDEVKLFDFGEVKVRVVMLDGEPWFTVKDVCLALGICIYMGKVNVVAALKRVPDDEKRIEGMNSIHPWPFDNRAKVVSLVSESGLYKLIMRSDKPEARKFQDWVTREVLPSIRKTGSYALKPGQPMPMPSTLAEACRGYAQALLDLAATEDEKAALAAQVDRLTVERDTLSDEKLSGTRDYPHYL